MLKFYVYDPERNDAKIIERATREEAQAYAAELEEAQNLTPGYLQVFRANLTDSQNE